MSHPAWRPELRPPPAGAGVTRPTRDTAFGCAAKLFQAKPSPAKQIQIKLLGFAWFYSSELALFNGLRRFPNKNFSPAVLLALALSLRLSGKAPVRSAS
jgi:hypothetical protein